VLSAPDASSGAPVRDDGGVRRPTPRLSAAAAVAVLAAGPLAGCGSFSEPSPPTGVDELTIPTPSPEPGDFVAAIDNPWFTDDEAAYVDPAAEVAVDRTVADGPEVDGVTTTAVTLGEVTDLYAQDERGNVWWFGRVGEWEAGTDGALAGLAVPAEPRVGDGFRRAEVPGRDLRAEVAELDGDDLVLEVVDGVEVTYVRYVRGAGLESIETGTGEVVLQRA
jgi:hypothetical protein